MRVVLDTNVVASALFWNGAPAELLYLCQKEEVSLYTSKALLAELRKTLSRRKFIKHVAASPVPVDGLVHLYSEGTWLVKPVEIQGVAPDPDDDVVLGTALAAGADFIATGDRAFLSVHQYKGIRILSVREALGVVASL